jgi:chromosome segregation ATPase
VTSASGTLSNLPGGRGFAPVGLSHSTSGAELRRELGEQVARVAALFRDLSGSTESDRAEISRLMALLAQRDEELRRAREALEAERAASASARKEATDLRSELDRAIAAHEAAMDELMREVERHRAAAEARVSESEAMFGRRASELEEQLGAALEGGTLLARYAIPANLIIKQLVNQKEVLSKLSATYYKQASTRRHAASQ